MSLGIRDGPVMLHGYPTASISDLLVVVMKKATAGISIS
ncbi:phage tail fiber protein [Escherichia albertii KF1]|nr:phage tail fiber protein [Escherichia albertii KF1]